MTTPPAQTKDILSFGPVSPRLQTRDAVPIELSGRAYDILLTRLSRPNEVISKSVRSSKTHAAQRSQSLTAPNNT